MWFHDRTLSDILLGHDGPTADFGLPLDGAEETEGGLHSVAHEARSRIRHFFNVTFDDPKCLPEKLEGIICDMWKQGWGSDDSNFNLMTTDFGSILATHLAATLRGQLVFRSTTNMAHTSIWWARRRCEAFPFHKMHERLTLADSEPLDAFTKRLELIVRAES